MKILESSWWRYAIVTGIECRLTTRNKKSKDTIWMDWPEQWNANGKVMIDDLWIYRDATWFALWWSAILIPKRVEMIEKKMRALWYTEFDYDSMSKPVVKCFK